MAGEIPIRVIHRAYTNSLVTNMFLERNAPISEVKARLFISTNRRRFYYVYLGPHPLILSELRIQRLGVQFTWPVLALFGKRLRDVEDEDPETTPLLNPLRSIPDSSTLLPSVISRPNRPLTLSDYGIEREATLYVINRRQIVDGMYYWTVFLIMCFGFGWVFYAYVRPKVWDMWNSGWL